MHETVGHGERVPLDGTLTGGVHRYRARVYYADTDFSGAVYHARYLEWLERGRSDYLRCLGIVHTELERDGRPLYWVVRRMQIDFDQVARLDDIVEVVSAVAETGGARVVMAQTITRDGTTVLRATVTAALIDAGGRPQRLPHAWRARFAGQARADAVSS